MYLYHSGSGIFDSISYLLRCEWCDRKIYLSMSMTGTIHHFEPSAICAECLQKKGLNKDFVKDFPEDAKKIQEWMEEDDCY